jgi:hypothetical protein
MVAGADSIMARMGVSATPWRARRAERETAGGPEQCSDGKHTSDGALASPTRDGVGLGRLGPRVLPSPEGRGSSLVQAGLYQPGLFSRHMQEAIWQS